MTAEPLSVTLEEGYNYYGYADGTRPADGNYIEENPLALTRINARVAVVAANIQLEPGVTHIFDGLTDAQVAIFNVPKTSNLFGTPLAINGAYLFGDTWPSTSGSYVNVAGGGAVEGSLFESAVVFPVVNTTAPYFYTNENMATSEKEQLLVVLRAKPTLGGTPIRPYPELYTDAAGYTYYPVLVNATKNSYVYSGENTGDSKIRRNTQYNISLTITGIGNPTIDEPETAYLDVFVEVAPWKVVNQHVTW